MRAWSRSGSRKLSSSAKRKKERKQTTQGRDGRTARRHHTGILRRGVWCASRRPPWESASSYLSSQSLAASRCNLHATSRSSHSRRSLPCHFLLCRVVLFCLVLRRRRLPVPCSRGFFRLSAQLRPPRGVSWPLESIELPSRKDHISDSHTDHLPTGHVVAQVHSLFEHSCLYG